MESMNLEDFKEEAHSQNLYFLENAILSELNQVWEQVKEIECIIHNFGWLDNSSLAIFMNSLETFKLQIFREEWVM